MQNLLPEKGDRMNLLNGYMKYGLLLVSLFLYLNLFAQESTPSYASFVIDHKEVVWAQVFPQHDSKENLSKEIFDFLKRKAWIRNIELIDGQIIADLENYRIDYKKYGGKYMNTSTLIRSGRWYGKVRVDFKDGKYRVMVYGLHYEVRHPTMNTGKMSHAAHMIHGTWTDWVLNKYRSAFRKVRHQNMDFMHFSLRDSFTLRETQFDEIDF
jgi:hypothetical protein